MQTILVDPVRVTTPHAPDNRMEAIWYKDPVNKEGRKGTTSHTKEDSVTSGWHNRHDE